MKTKLAIAALAAGLFLLAARFACAVETVNIVLDNKNFAPIPPHRMGGVSVSWRGCKATDTMGKLKKIKPASVTREPQYQGKYRLYGYMLLGTQKNNRFDFALDVTAPDNMLLYFDSNKNGDLTDDGPPLKHIGKFDSGKNGIATEVDIPWQNLVDNIPFKGMYKLWFIVNPAQWAQSGFTHYSMTQIMGTVTLNGKLYTVVIADRAETDNNADFLNDGLYLRPGAVPNPRTIEEIRAIHLPEPRYISPEEAAKGVEIDGRTYRFTVSYPK